MTFFSVSLPSICSLKCQKVRLARRPFSTTRTVEFASVDQFWVIIQKFGSKTWNNLEATPLAAVGFRNEEVILALDFHVAHQKKTIPIESWSRAQGFNNNSIQPWTSGIDYLQTKGVGRSVQGCLSKACLQMMSRYAEIHTVLWCQSLQTLCACKYFEARVTSLVVSKKSWTTIFDMYPCVLPFLFPANRYYPCQLFHFDQGTNAEIQCRRGHIDPWEKAPLVLRKKLPIPLEARW